MSQGASSIGTTLQLGEEADTWILEDCIIDVTLTGNMTQFFEDKCLGQDDRTVPSVPTWNTPDTMTFRKKYRQDNFDQLNDWQDDQTKLYAKLTFPKLMNDAGTAFQVSPAYATFEGYLQQVTTPFPEDGGRVVHDIVFKRTTKIVFTPGDSLS